MGACKPLTSAREAQCIITEYKLSTVPQDTAAVFFLQWNKKENETEGPIFWSRVIMKKKEEDIRN